MAETRVNGVTVDADGTIVREDAVWIQAVPDGWHVQVSVPDAAATIPRSEEDWLSGPSGGARRRELSLYPDTPTPAITLSLTVSRGGTACTFNAFRSTLHLAATTTFGEFSRQGEQAIPGLAGASEAATALRAWRINSSGTRMTPPSVPRMERAIHEILVTANLEATRFVHRHGRGLVYTCPSAPLTQGGGKRWSATPERVENVLADQYATFTTPLNRFSDLVNLRCLAAAMDMAPEPYTPAERADAAALQTAREAEAGRIRHEKAGRPAVTAASLGGMNPSAFASHIGAVCRGEQAPDGVDAELARRLEEGGVFARTLPLILLHPDSPASAATRASAVAILRGAEGGRWLADFWAQVCTTRSSRSVMLELPRGDEASGYTISARYMEACEAGWGTSPEGARRDALGRLVARVAGTDPEGPPQADARLMWPAFERMTQALRALGLLPPPPRYETAGEGRHLAHIDVIEADGSLRRFSASGYTRARALEDACEDACAQLGAPDLPAADDAAVTPDMLASAMSTHPGSPTRALNLICRRSGMAPPETDTLDSGGEPMVRVAAAGIVAVRPGVNRTEAREMAAAAVLEALTLRFRSSAEPGLAVRG